ncbi:putative phage abortive infection protein [Rhizobium leguminosarum]|uniref:putative phage abortive infection protein n=1 Tax=Rhizobium leguminosarum TaxID=384 RepID=UPI003F9988C8
MGSNILRVLMLLLVMTAVVTIWIFWGMAGPRISELFITEGFLKLPIFFSPPIESLPAGVDVMGKAGQWGDGFGALNALFAGLAFTGALAALFMQGQAAERQNKDYHRQRFESSYFELLALLREARREVRFRYSLPYRKANRIPPASERGKIQTEAAAFRTAMYELRYLIRTKTTAAQQTKPELERVYRLGIHGPFESTFGPYFRIVYTVLRRIKDDTVLTEREKIQYSNLLRSQLTSPELALAGFNGLMPQANDFSVLLTEFHMLKYLPNGLARRALERVYEPDAFAARND